MMWWLQNIIAGIIRWGVPTIITAVFAALGFSPKEWLAVFIADQLLWVTHPLFRIVIVFVGIMLVSGILIRGKRRVKPEIHIDWSIRKALDWITFESRWGWQQLAKYHWFHPMGAPEELRLRAVSGFPVIQGRLLGDYKFDDIDRDYWNAMQIKVDDYLAARRPHQHKYNPKIGVEFRQIAHIEVPNYDEYRVLSDKVIQSWPKARWWYRWLMRIEWAARYLLASAKSFKRWIKHHVARNIS